MELIKNFLAAAGDFCLHKALPGVILLVIGILVIRLILHIVKLALERSPLEKAAQGLIKSVLRIALYVLLGLIVASALGIDVTGIVALASVLTLAVSLSVQNALTNIIGGFTILYTKPFSLGEFVEIAGQSGTVCGIGLTYTKLTTADNKVVSIPNSAVVAAQIVNYSVAGTRRVDIAVSAAYTCPVEQVLEALLEAGKVPTALDTPAPFAAVKGYGESAIEYTLQIWCEGADYWKTTFTANQNIKAVFDRRGIQMTYPHLNVHIEK